MKFLPGNGVATATGTLAVDRRFKKDGEQQADFIPVVIWGKIAESTANYCGSKGDRICVVGRIQTRTYDAKDGTKRYVTEVVAEEVEFLNDKKKGGSTPAEIYTGSDDITPVDDEEIPF